MIKICLVCGMPDTIQNYRDVHGCNDCYAIEQGFVEVEDFMPGITVDEDGILYREDDELEGPIGSVYDYK